MRGLSIYSLSVFTAIESPSSVKYASCKSKHSAPQLSRILLSNSQILKFHRSRDEKGNSPVWLDRPIHSNLRTYASYDIILLRGGATRDAAAELITSNVSLITIALEHLPRSNPRILQSSKSMPPASHAYKAPGINLRPSPPSIVNPIFPM
jgi:hypothetical protein